MVERVGLITRGKDFVQVPLDSIYVKANIYGILAHFEASFTYTNLTPDPIEVEFKHPLYSESTLIGIEAVIDGKKVKGIVKEKGEAKTVYEDAIASGNTAVLVEEDARDILGILLGNLPPEKKCTVTLQLLQQLEVGTEGIQLLLPTTLKPRYEPIGSQAQPSFASQSQNEVSVPGIYKFSFEMFLVGEIGKLKKITSPSHTLAEFTATDGRKGMQVTSSDPLNADLVVYIDFDDIKPLSALIEPPLPDREKTNHPYIDNPAVLLTFMPKSHGLDLSGKGEFVFIIDQSGSMSGGAIQDACETLDMLVRSLTMGCYFNIIGFGSSFVSLFDSSVEYSQATLDKAVHHISRLKANLGGTEILQPLQHVYSRKPRPGFSRQIFLLTDGAVSNIGEVVNIVGQNSSNTRAFTFGIGSGVSSALVNKVAKAGRGKAVFISSMDRMQSRVMEVMNYAMSPSYTDISIVGTKSMVVYPQSIPVLFENEPFVVIGFFNENILKGEKVSATLKYSSAAETKVATIEFTLADTISSHFPHLPEQLVHQFGVSKALKQLEDTIASKDECITLSTNSNIICKHTSFVAVGEDQHQMIEGSMKVYKIVNDTLAFDSPMLLGAAMPQMSARLFATPMAAAPQILRGFGHRSGPPPPPPVPTSSRVFCDSAVEMMDDAMDMDDEEVDFIGSDSMSASAPVGSRNTVSKLPAHQRIIKLQRAEGFWQHSGDLESMLCCKTAKGSCPKDVNDLSVWMTILCLSFLQEHSQAYKSEWQLIFNKGERWVKTKILDCKLSYEQIFNMASNFLKK